MKRLWVTAAFAAFALSAFALPSIEAVQSEISAGHYAQAEEMMREVVAAKPDSARARYVHAEILAHDKRFALAAEEAAQARRLDPSLSFTQPEKFKAFSQLLDREQSATSSNGGAVRPVSEAGFYGAPGVPSNGGMPSWVWAAGAAMLVLALWRSWGARTATPAHPLGMGPTFGAPGTPVDLGTGAQTGAYGMPAAPATSGNGLLGTGLAVAGGVAAGLLAERLFESHRDIGLNELSATPQGGWMPGVFDDSNAKAEAARELEERPIDLGTGDGWGGGDVDPGSSASTDGW